MESSRERGAVTVNNATNSDHGIQIIGHATIGTINVGATEDERPRRRHAVLRWLSPSDEAIKLQQIIHEESRTNHKLEATGHWFIHSSSFTRWLEGSSRLTWVSGGMGCGKTVLFFLAVEKVREMCQGDVSKNFGYFYCTSRSSLGQSITVLFRSLLRQLCRPTEVPVAIQNLYDLCDEGLDHRSPTIHELARNLGEIVAPSSSSTTPTPARKDYYLLIDGLDELKPSSRDEFLEELRPILSQNYRNVHILVTSRPQKEIEESLQEVVALDSLPVDTQSVQADIRTFVTSVIRSHKQLCRLPRESHEAILTRVVDQSHGMFRWAFLQIQSLKALKPPVTPGKVRDKLQSLPKDLDETYERMLDDLDEFDKLRAKRALMWLVFSARQLYIEELVDACAIDVKKNPLVDDKLTASDIETLLQDLILIQPSLTKDQDTVEFQTHTVMLVHASIREFLVKERMSAERPVREPFYFALQEQESNISLAQSCLAYLLCYNMYALRASHEEFPLRRYAWYHWEEHIDVTAEHCVPTIPTATLRRKARRLFGLIKGYLSRHMDHVEPNSTIDDAYAGDLTAFLAVMDGVGHFVDSHQLDLQSLKTALNVPYFHPEYDEFCPMMSASEPEGKKRSISSGSVTQLNLRGRVASYQHRRLPEPSTWIRLLEILPAVDPDTMIRCRLFGAELSDAPPYAALSYAWGANHDPEVIAIEGHAFLIIESQLILLRSMRSRSEDSNPAIWLDALCIDQQDVRERSAQVSIMGDIFAQAREVVVGLSDGDESDDRGVHLLADLASSTSSLTRSDRTEEAVNLAKEAVLRIDRSGGWEDILRIFQNAWWTRRWMIQEIILGIKAVVLFGSMSFNFNIVEQVMLVEDFIKGVLRESKSPSFAAIERNPGWQAAKQMIYTRLEYRRNRQLTLPMLLWRFRNNVSTDPRDTIYALLGLCELQNSPHGSPQVDYSRSAYEVFLDTSRWILQTYKSLDLLSIRSAFRDIHNSLGSSWFLPLHVEPRERQPLNPGVFAGIDSFKIYSAAGAEIESILLQPEHVSMLTICGMAFDTVAKVLGPTCHDMSSKETFIDFSKEIGQVQSSRIVRDDNQKTVEAKWRTLLANQWPLGTKLSTSTCQGVKIPPQTENEEKALLEIIDIQYHLPQLKGRRIIVTAGGCLGLALEEVKLGDDIVVMPGGALPYVLRSTFNDERQFLGECYVHDCMDGQIVDSVSQPRQEWWTEVFKIV